MLIQNVRIENAETPSDLRITNGMIKEIAAHLTPISDESVLDGGGNLLLPPFVESHVHLDTSLSLDGTGVNRSGTLFEGIKLWGNYRKKLTKENVKSRARKLLRMQAAQGVQFVRSHVDVTAPDFTALEALLELREEMRDVMDIQLVAFPQEGICSFPDAKKRLETALQMGADAVGAIPHFEFTREYAVDSLNYAMALAEKYDKLVDVHCDEIDDPESRGLEVLAARAYESGLLNRVTASHTTAMHSYPNAYVTKLMRLLSMSQINIVANPLVNINLQGRMDTYPKRRGVTRVPELLGAGVNVSFGHDDIYDPFYPLGTGDPRDTVFMGLHVCQMTGYEDIQNSYKLIGENGAKTLHLGNQYGISVGKPANLVIWDAPDFYHVLNEKSVLRYSLRNGKLIAKGQPATIDILF